MADATATALASEAEKAAQEALKRQKAEEDALLKAYQTGSQDIYGGAKTAAGGLLSGSKSEIEALYGKGYTDLQNLVGQESEAAIKESLRPIEGKLGAQGLLGGPSGALNEALAGAAERVRNAGIGRLADYKTAETGALANVYGSTANQLSALEQAYGGQQQGLLSTALGQQLATSGKATDIANQYGQTGLEAALGTNRMVLEQAGQKDILGEQAALNAEAVAAANATQAAELKTRQDAYDRQLYALQTSIYNSSSHIGNPFDSPLNYKDEAMKILGPRPA